MKMKHVITVFIVYLSLFKCFGQKPALSYADLIDVPIVHSQQISNDGRYVLYIESSAKKGGELFIKSADESFETKISC